VPLTFNEKQKKLDTTKTSISWSIELEMAPITLHPRTQLADEQIVSTNPLPGLLKTPQGLAVVELQGTINLPVLERETVSQPVSVGRLDFPDYREDALDPTNTAWMRRVYLYVGQHQRLTGEVKKLPKALAIVRRKAGSGPESLVLNEAENDPSVQTTELEVVEIVKFKLVFSQRPEPVGTAVG
jgi:chromosome transmission fidelity protein 8